MQIIYAVPVTSRALEGMVSLRNKININRFPQCLFETIGKDCINTNYYGADSLS